MTDLSVTIPALQTERLRLVPFAEAHPDAFTRLQHHPRAAEWAGGLPDTGTTVELRGRTQVLDRITRDDWLVLPAPGPVRPTPEGRT